MSNTITINEPNVDALMTAYQGIQLESAPFQTGLFSLVARVPYVLDQTTYTIVDPAGIASTWYRSARYTPSALGPYSAAWPVAGYGAGNTLQLYRQRLADMAGYNVRTQTTGNAQLAQQVVCTDFLSTELEDSFFGNTWLYQPSGINAGQCRRIQYEGLDPSTGTITLESPLPNITPGGTQIEIYGRLPPVRREGRLGLNDLVNRALNECWTIKRLPLVGVQNQKLYPLGAAFPWLQAEDQLVEVYYRAANANPNDDDMLMYNWRWVAGGDNPSVEVSQPLNTGDTLLIEAYVPMAWWINSGGAWGLAASPGLQLDTDQGLMSPLGMEVVGSAWVFNELSKWGLPEDQQVYHQRYAQARAAANQWKRLTLQHPQVRKNHWPAVMTVRTRDNYGQGYTILTPG